MTTNKEKLQKLFEAALRAMDEPLVRPVPSSRANLFPPPPWRAQEELQAKAEVVPQLKAES